MDIKKMLYFHIITIILFLSCSPLFAEESTTAPALPINTTVSPITMNVSLKKLTAEDGFVFKSVGAAKDIYLPIQNGWDVKKIRVRLNIVHENNIKHADSITVLIKDFPISTLTLDNVTDKNITWDVEIPEKYIKGPVITLQLRRNWLDNGVLCEEIEKSLDWIAVQGDSTITYDYIQNTFNPNLSIFPIPFINTLSLFKDKVSIFIPDDWDLNELESTYYVANSLYKRRTWRGVNITGVTFNAITDEIKNNNNIIIVGEAKKIKPLLANVTLPMVVNDQGLLLDNNNQPIGKDRGVVMEIVSPWNPYYAVLIVTGNNTNAVQKAASALRTSNFEKWVLFNKYAFIDTSEKEVDQQIDWNDTTLSDLGYNDIVVYGGGTNTIKYEFNLPTNKEPDAIDMNLHYSVSPLLSDINNSFISLRVNDFPITGEKIKIGSESSMWNIRIPARNLLPGKNTIAFSFNLKFHNRDCMPDDLSLSWGTIYSDSKIKVKFGKNDVSYSFSDLDDIEQDVNLFIPKQDTIFTKKETVQLVINMATNIVNAKHFNIRYDSDDMKELAKNSNVIYVGNMTTNSILNSLKQYFPFSYVGNQVIIKPSIMPYLHMSEEVPVGLLELIKSPYDPKKLFLLITADSSDGYDLTVDAFFNPAKNQYLRGNTALVYSDGTFTSIDTNKLEIKSQNFMKMKKVKDTAWKIAILLIVIIFGGLLLVIGIRRAKRYFSKNINNKE